MLPTDVTTGIKPHQEKKGIWKAQKKKSNQISRKWVEFEFPIFLINDPKWMNSKLWNFFFDFVYLVGRHPFDRKFVHPRLWWRCRRKRSVQSRRQPKSASRKSCAVSFSMESNNSDNNDTITVGESCENNRPIESSIKSIFVIEFHHHLVQPIAFFTQTTTNTDDEIINSRAQDTQPENSGKFKWYQFLFSLFFFFF